MSVSLSLTTFFWYLCYWCPKSHKITQIYPILKSYRQPPPQILACSFLVHSITSASHLQDCLCKLCRFMIREIRLDHHASLGLHSLKFPSNMITGVSYISLLCHLSFMFDRWTTGGNTSISNVPALSRFLCPNLQHLTKLQLSLTLAVKL